MPGMPPCPHDCQDWCHTLGPRFDASGVKQGDPGCPLLVGLFTDRLGDWLPERLGDVGVGLGGERLLYADDLTVGAR